MNAYSLFVTGIALVTSSLILLSIFAARMQAGMLMASRFGTDGIAFQSAFVVILLCAVFTLGVFLVFASIKKIRKTKIKK